MAKELPGSSLPETLECLFVEETETRESVLEGLKLHVTKWKPKVAPRALLCVCHGVAEHMGRYKLLAEMLSSSGIMVFGHDHIGHGRSDGDRVNIDSYDTYVKDVVGTVRVIKKQFPDIPCILMGHSMGGLVAGLTAVSSQELFTGLILSAALVEIDPKAAGWFMQTMTKILALVSPQFGIKKVNIDDISSISDEVEAYSRDDLIYHGEVKAKWGSETMKGISRMREALKEIQIPLLLLHGTDDHIVSFSGSQFIVSEVSSVQVQFEKFEGSKHEIFHDVEQDRARKLVETWITRLIS